MLVSTLKITVLDTIIPYQLLHFLHRSIRYDKRHFRKFSTRYDELPTQLYDILTSSHYM